MIILKTKYSEIVDTSSIGKADNPIKMNELLSKAALETLRPAVSDRKRTLLLCIDVQNDFMENGSLAVPNSSGDVARLTHWMYDNMEDITKIAFSIDTHNPFQIFHPCWWVDENGHNPPPFTMITLQDLDDGKWMPTQAPIWSRDYVLNLEKQGRFNLVIWTYHCLQGTFGHSLENQFGNIVYFHSVAKKSIARRMVKGNNPKTEMYGILKAEYDPTNKVDIGFLNDVKDYDMIIIAGEAKSHCVRRSIEQILEHFKNDLATTKKIVILEDCMSSIPTFEDDTDSAFEDFKKNYHVNIVKSIDFNIKDVF